MGRILLVATLAACTHHAAPTGPAWPNAGSTASDGGESLAPHLGHQVTAVERSDDDAKPTVPPPAAPAAAVVTPTVEGGAVPAVAPTAQPMEETITTEDIVIEIDD
jgi:hypothetical protein